MCVWGPINEYNYTYEGIVVDKFIDVEDTFEDFIKKKVGLNEKGENEKCYYINFEKNGKISEHSPLEVSFQQYDEIQVGDYIKKDRQSLELQIFYSP